MISFSPVAGAQSVPIEVLYNFPEALQENGGNYVDPGNLVEGPDRKFYGFTVYGGLNHRGTLFRMDTNGVVTTLINFGGVQGVNPTALVLGPDGNFYGTTFYGTPDQFGNNQGYGTMFRLTTNGTLTTLVSSSLRSAIAHGPNSLVLGPDGALYGTSLLGGTNGGNGSLFRLTTNGVVTALYSFGRTTYVSGVGVNTDGVSPSEPLAVGPDGNLYGTTHFGGPEGLGTVFGVTTSGALAMLISGDPIGYNTGLPNGSDGLVLGPDGCFYGSTPFGGSSGQGGLFQLTTNGALTTFASFDGTNGTDPASALTLGHDGQWYGLAGAGGAGNYGTIFEATTNGALIAIAQFDSPSGPSSELTLGTDGNFYGTTGGGGANGTGFIYRVRSRAYIQSCLMATNGFQVSGLNVGGSGQVVLESSTNLSAWTPILTNGPSPTMQFLDTTAITQPQQFYRTRQQ